MPSLDSVTSHPLTTGGLLNISHDEQSFQETVKHCLTWTHVKDIRTAARLGLHLWIIHDVVWASCLSLTSPGDLQACQLFSELQNSQLPWERTISRCHCKDDLWPSGYKRLLPVKLLQYIIILNDFLPFSKNMICAFAVTLTFRLPKSSPKQTFLITFEHFSPFHTLHSTICFWPFQWCH